MSEIINITFGTLMTSLDDEVVRAVQKVGIDVDKEELLKALELYHNLVRCKECRHGVDYYHEGDCYCSNPKWGLKYFGGSWEFYCADGERRG